MGRTNGINSEDDHDVKKVLKFYTPNNGLSGIPNNPNFYPEMDYLCFIIAEKTNRLIDVEAMPALEFGISRAQVTPGESYGRGIAGVLLPDVSVLNEKKKIELEAESQNSQTPYFGKGQIELTPGQRIKPHQYIKGHRDADLRPLFQGNRNALNASQALQNEANFIAMGLQRDKMQEPEPKSHRTATEFIQYRDGQGKVFALDSNRYYRQLAVPVINGLLYWLVATQRIPEMPTQLLESDLKIEFEPVNAFTYGQESETGQNVQRAFAPVAPFIEVEPELLDVFDKENYLRGNLSRYELTKYVNSREQVAQKRQARAKQAQQQAMMESRGGGANPQQQYENEQQTAGLQSGNVNDYSMV